MHLGRSSTTAILTKLGAKFAPINKLLNEPQRKLNRLIETVLNGDSRKIGELEQACAATQVNFMPSLKLTISSHLPANLKNIQANQLSAEQKIKKGCALWLYAKLLEDEKNSEATQYLEAAAALGNGPAIYQLAQNKPAISQPDLNAAIVGGSHLALNALCKMLPQENTKLDEQTMELAESSYRASFHAPQSYKEQLSRWLSKLATSAREKLDNHEALTINEIKMSYYAGNVGGVREVLLDCTGAYAQSDTPILIEKLADQYPKQLQNLIQQDLFVAPAQKAKFMQAVQPQANESAPAEQIQSSISSPSR